MNKFIAEYMHSTFDDSLIGKSGFFADDKFDLVDMVDNNVKLKNYDKLERFGNNIYPFGPLHSQKCFKWFYYDPYYHLKEAVDVDGKTLEVNLDGVWTEVTDLESFFMEYPNPYSPEQYRTESNRRIVTHRELAKWLSAGNGQVRSSSGDNKNICVSGFGYAIDLDDKQVDGLLIRSWDDVAWHLPTASYLEDKYYYYSWRKPRFC